MRIESMIDNKKRVAFGNEQMQNLCTLRLALTHRNAIVTFCLRFHFNSRSRCKMAPLFLNLNRERLCFFYMCKKMNAGRETKSRIFFNVRDGTFFERKKYPLSRTNEGFWRIEWNNPWSFPFFPLFFFLPVDEKKDSFVNLKIGRNLRESAGSCGNISSSCFPWSSENWQGRTNHFANPFSSKHIKTEWNCLKDSRFLFSLCHGLFGTFLFKKEKKEWTS